MGNVVGPSTLNGVDQLAEVSRSEQLFNAWMQAGLIESRDAFDDRDARMEDYLSVLGLVHSNAGKTRSLFQKSGMIEPALDADLQSYLDSLDALKSSVAEGNPVRFGFPVTFPFVFNPEPQKEHNVGGAQADEVEGRTIIFSNDFSTGLSARMRFRDSFFDLPTETSYEVYKYVSYQFWRFHLNFALLLVAADNVSIHNLQQSWQKMRLAMICLDSCGAVNLDRSQIGRFAKNLDMPVDDPRFVELDPCIDFDIDVGLFNFQLLHLLDKLVSGFYLMDRRNVAYRSVGSDVGALLAPERRKRLYAAAERVMGALPTDPHQTKIPLLGILDASFLAPEARPNLDSLLVNTVEDSWLIQNIEEALKAKGFDGYESAESAASVDKSRKVVGVAASRTLRESEPLKFSMRDLESYVAGRFKTNKGKATTKYRDKWDGEAAKAIYDCDHRASIVMGEFSGSVNIADSADLKSVWIERRDPGDIAYPSNLACRGMLTLNGGKRFKNSNIALDFEIGPRGEVSFVLDGKAYSRRDFEAMRHPAVVNFYTEASARVLVALRRVLVREERVVVEKSLRDAGLEGSGDSGDRASARITSQFSLSPRIENLVGGSSKSKTRTEGVSHVEVRELISGFMDRIRNKEEIKKDELEGLIIYQRGEELELEGEKTNLYIPLDPLPILRLAVEGAIDLNEYFVMLSRDRTVRGGYNANRIEEGVMTCVQNRPSDYSEALRRVIEERFKIRFVDRVSDVTSIGIPDVDGERVLEPIHSLRIGTREELDEGDLDVIELEEIRAWVRGEVGAVNSAVMDRVHSVVVEDGDRNQQLIESAGALNDGGDFVVRRVQFHAPQNVQFVSASYQSLGALLKEE